MTLLIVKHWELGDRYASGVRKIKRIRSRENTSARKWNERTLRPAGKLKQLTHAMDKYHWNILGLCRCAGKSLTDTKGYFSGEKDRYDYEVGFLMKCAVLGYRPVSSRLITIRLRAVPFSI